MVTITQARSRVALAVRQGNTEAEHDARAVLGLLRVQNAIQTDLPHLRAQDRARLATLLTGTTR